MNISGAKRGFEIIQNPGRFFIGGQWVEPSSDSAIDVITPATEKLFVSVAEAQEADVNRAVAAARTAFDAGPWPRMSHSERAGYIRAIGRELANAQRQRGAVLFAATVQPSSADAPRGVADSNTVRVLLGRGGDDVLCPVQRCCEKRFRRFRMPDADPGRVVQLFRQGCVPAFVGVVNRAGCKADITTW